MTIKKPSRWVYWLLAFGILISGPRFSGAFAAAIGIDLIGTSGIWAAIEIGSGWALALFEAMAIAYIASRFRKIQVLSDDDSLPLAKRIYPANAIYWAILLMGQVFLLLTIPAVSTVHLATQTFKVDGESVSVPNVLTWSNILQNHLTWIWLFITASASTMFVFLIGLVMDDFGVLNQKKDSNVHVYTVYSALRRTKPVVDPVTLSKEAGVTVKEAADFLDELVPSVISTDPMVRLNLLKERMNNENGS